MSEFKYKVGDKVRIKSLDWYNRNKDKNGYVDVGVLFDKEMSRWCGKTMTIIKVNQLYYTMEEDGISQFFWTDEMIEGLVEDVNVSEFKHTQDEIMKMLLQGALNIPEGYCLRDQDGNIINAKYVTLEKKKREYPKTFEECCKILGLLNVDLCFNADYRSFDASKEQWKRLGLMNQFYQLLICRDAYWKIAGDEMGLDKPWEPDWNDDKQDKYGFHNEVQYTIINSAAFVFPTEEMRDSFKDNFGPDIDICKTLL